MRPTRRGFITGLISLVAAPAIVRAGSLMPVKVMPQLLHTEYYCNRVIRTYMDVEAIRDRNILFQVQDWRYVARLVNIDVTHLVEHA